MWDVIVFITGHCLSIFLINLVILKKNGLLKIKIKIQFCSNIANYRINSHFCMARRVKLIFQLAEKYIEDSSLHIVVCEKSLFQVKCNIC